MAMDVMAVLSDLAAPAGGMVTTAQAAAAGVSRPQLTRLTERGVLERLTHGVYAFTALGYEMNRDLRAAWMALEPASSTAERLRSRQTAAVVSHTSAAGLHQLGELLDDVHEFTVPTRKQTRRPHVRLHRAHLAPEEVTIVDGLPTTTIARTVADLLLDGHDMDHVARIAATAMREGRLWAEDLHRALHPLASRYGLPDGEAVTLHLLNSIDLNAPALARELIASGIGQALSTRAAPTGPSALAHSDARPTVTQATAPSSQPATHDQLVHALTRLDAAVLVRLQTALMFSRTFTSPAAPAAPAAQAS